MKITKEDYKKVIEVLYKFKSNSMYLSSDNKIREYTDLIKLGGGGDITGIRPKYAISDSVLNTVINIEKIQNDEFYLTAYKEYSVVVRAMSRFIPAVMDVFTEMFYNKKTKYEIMDALPYCERQIERFKKTVIYITYDELKRERLL